MCSFCLPHLPWHALSLLLHLKLNVTPGDCPDLPSYAILHHTLIPHSSSKHCHSCTEIITPATEYLPVLPRQPNLHDGKHHISDTHACISRALQIAEFNKGLQRDEAFLFKLPCLLSQENTAAFFHCIIYDSQISFLITKVRNNEKTILT